MIEHFTDQYTAPNTVIDESLFEAVSPRLTPQQCNMLTTEVTPEEIKEAPFSIGSERAPGPNGYTSKFFEVFWETTQPQLIEMVRSFFTSLSIHPLMNHTNLTLIPKIDHPSKPSQFRPIGLCNVTYKIISKILVNRIRPILPFLISSYQSAFVSQRSIHENIAIAVELFHYIRTSNRTKDPKISLKLDIQSLDWGFIKKAFARLGFPSTFMDYIMLCISTVTYSININDTPHGYITPTRGIRQGDPLSSYIFIICAKILSTNLGILENQKKIEGLRIS